MVDYSNLKRIALLVLGGVILTISLWPDFADDMSLLAQQSPIGTPTPTGTITLTPGPTATKVKRVVNEIVSPTEADAISGNTPIIGTPLINSYHRHDIHISPADQESVMVTELTAG